jgi:hypothetical protein
MACDADARRERDRVRRARKKEGSALAPTKKLWGRERTDFSAAFSSNKNPRHFVACGSIRLAQAMLRLLHARASVWPAARSLGNSMLLLKFDSRFS